MKIFIVIPAYEPDNNLIKLCQNLIQNNVCNIVIVNDGSTDSNSVSVFAQIQQSFPDIHILTHKENRGKGRALKTAFEFLLNNTDADGCITADSDGQHKVEDIIQCMNALCVNPQSLILGCRQFDWNTTPFKSRIGNRYMLNMFTRATGKTVSDTQTGLRGLSKAYMNECLSLEGERFEFEMNMMVTFAYKYSIVEVPIACIYNFENKGTHFRPFKDSLKIVKIMRKSARKLKKQQIKQTSI